MVNRTNSATDGITEREKIRELKMTYKDFMQVYDVSSNNKFVVEYKAPHDPHTRKGVVINKPYLSAMGQWCVEVDNFTNSILLKNVRAIRKTGEVW